jgi:type I restriction enzyme S subunit
MSANTGAWANVTVEECCEILDRKRVPVNGEDREKRIGEVPYYGANGLQGYIDAFIFDEPLILIAEDGGRFDEYATRPIAYRISGKSWVNNHAHVLKAKAGFYQDAIFYSLEHKDIQSFIVGGTRSKLNQSALKAITISLPQSKSEQTKIAEILSTVDRAIEQTEVLIAKLQRLKTGLMQDLLTRGIDEHGNLRSEQTHKFKDSPLGRIPVEWECVDVSMVIELKHGYQFRDYDFVEHGIPVIKIGNVTSQGLDLSDLTYVLSSRQQEFEKYNISNGDVLMSLTGNIGRVVEVQNLPCPVLQNYRVGKFVTQSDDLLHAFMKTVLSSGSLFSQLDTLSNQSAQANFGTQDLGRLMMPLPNSINEQKKISELLELASRSISAKDGALVKLRALKTALMQDLLTGRKRVAALLDGKETSA